MVVKRKMNKRHK